MPTWRQDTRASGILTPEGVEKITNNPRGQFRNPETHGVCWVLQAPRNSWGKFPDAVWRKSPKLKTQAVWWTPPIRQVGEEQRVKPGREPPRKKMLTKNQKKKTYLFALWMDLENIWIHVRWYKHKPNTWSKLSWPLMAEEQVAWNSKAPRSAWPKAKSWMLLWRGPAQDVPYYLILWYVLKTIYLS